MRTLNWASGLSPHLELLGSFAIRSQQELAPGAPLAAALVPGALGNGAAMVALSAHFVTAGQPHDVLR